MSMPSFTSKGGVCAVERTLSSSGITSIVPVFICGFTAPARFATVPTTATADSGLRLPQRLSPVSSATI